jgi:RNA polymerase sigma factor (sigma-70 family)
MTDYKDILKLIANKEPKGLEELYTNYGNKFYNYSILRWHLNEDEAWEVVYRTLETLLLKLSNYQFESKAHFDNFIFKVHVNFLRQYFRSKRNQDISNIEFHDLNNAEETPHYISKQINKNVFADYYKAEVIESPYLIALNEALDKLDPKEKDILLLRAQNYSYDEIADFLKIENSQLKVKHHRAKQKLLNIINEIKTN